VIWFDAVYPGWRRQFSLVTTANGRSIFARVGPEQEADRSAETRRPARQ